MNDKFKPLFTAIKFKKQIEIKNRIVMAPMTNFLSNSDGTVSDKEIDYYARRTGDVGMVITACANVTLNGKGFKGEIGCHSDELIPSLHRLAQAIKINGTKAILQIFHGGRMCPPDLVPGGDVVSASAVAAEGKDTLTPRELSEEDIQYIITAFGESTRRAIEAGFDGVEIHGANGYLLQQFFSPHSNRRDDRWGGSMENRMRFPLAVVDEVRKVVTTHAKEPFIVGYRFSPEESETPGITMTDTLTLIDTLADMPLDYLHVSLNDFWSKPRRGDRTDIPRINLIQEQVAHRIPVIGVGSIYTPDQAVKAFDTGISMLALGRELIIDPDWMKKIEQGLETEIEIKLKRDGQERLVVPDPLWKVIINTPGWFPKEDE